MEPASEPRPAVAPSHPRARLAAFGRWAGYPIAVFLASRAGIVLVTELSLYLDPALHRGAGPTPPLYGLCRWDCGWYASIANGGYASPSHAAFFPLFPLLGRATAWLTHLPAERALVLVANLAALGAALAVYRVFEEVSDAGSARAALALQVFWPFSFFSAAGYTESLLILFTALGLWLALRRCHFAAGAAVGIASLGRHLALIAGLGLLAEHVRERGLGRRLWWTPKILALLVPLALFAIQPLFLWRRFGDPFFFFTVRGGVWEPHGIWAFFGRAWWPEVGVYVGFAPVILAGAALLLRRRAWWSLAAFAIPYLLVVLSVGLTGLGRFPASCWPAFLPFGAWLSKRPALLAPAVGTFALLQGMFVYLYSHSYPIN